METRYQKIAVAFVVSLLFHVPLLYLGALALLRGADFESGEIQDFEVIPLTRSFDPRNPSEEEKEEDEEYDPDEKVPDGQVVSSMEDGENKRPDDSEYLSTRDQTVEQETRAFIRQSETNPGQPRVEVPYSRGTGAQLQEQSDERLLAGLILQEQGLSPSHEGEHRARQSPDVAPNSINLNPSYSLLSDALGGGGLDHLGSDVEPGSRTLLNTVRWRHAPFFERVKRQVEQYWHPDIAFSRHDPGGHIYGFRDRETVIRVVLNAQGALERAYVIRASGADFLDDEGLGALEQAAPFPNPPRSLVDERTQRIVFTFGFIVELGERPIFRLRRYR